MRCPSCGFINPDGAKFCGECAAPLQAARVCANCGFHNPPGHKFCGECANPIGAAPERDPRSYTPKHLADKILASKSALEGERKQVTVLFADVRGSMELAESVDPEEWHGILDEFFKILADGVHRFEGTVNQYTGDGIMALFGAPIAHEDHAQRACYAALHLREALRTYADELRLERGLSFAVRMGLNSGEVIVGRIGDDLRMDYTAQGTVVALAQRMEQLASPGTALLAEATAHLVDGYFAMRDLGPAQIKGAATPVRVFELTDLGAVRSRFDMSRARGLSRFVGRADEMALLGAALDRAIAGTGSVVGIVAEPGTGKSRLTFEIEERLRNRGMRITRTQAYDHTKTIPLVPVIELYRQALGVASDDAPREARQKIAGGVVLLDDTARDALPLLFDFLGVPDPERPAPQLDAEPRERFLLDLIRRFTLARGAREPALLVFEDLHWADPASVRFVAALCEVAEASRTLLLLNFRPEFRAAWTGRTWYQQIALRPLDATATYELLTHWLGTDPTLSALIETIQARAAGNPLFVEEIVLSLIESGVLAGERGRFRLVRPIGSIQLPVTVQALLAARIDRLAAGDKDVLQIAAVIGLVFPEPLLARASGLGADDLRGSLARLKDTELIVERSLYPEAEYAFRHPLVQEAAYQSQLSDRKTRTHGAVARSLEATADDRADELAPLIAQHFDAANDAEQSLLWHSRAASWLQGRDTNAAIHHARRAVVLVSNVAQTNALIAAGQDARLTLVGVLTFTQGWSAEIESTLEEAKRIAEESHDDTSLAQFLNREGFARDLGGNHDWEAPFLRAEELAARIGDTALQGVVAHLYSVSCISRGRVAQAHVVATRADGFIEANPSGANQLARFNVAARRFNIHAGIKRLRGSVADALADVERGLAVLGDSGDLLARSLLLNQRARSQILLEGARSIALASARESSAILSNLGNPASANAWLAELLVRADEPNEAIELARAAYSAVRDSGTLQRQALQFVFSLAEAEAMLGHFEAATEHANEAVTLADQLNVGICNSRLTRARVRLAVGEAGDADAIADDLATALSSARDDGNVLVEAETLEAYARLAELTGNTAERERYIREALVIWERSGATAPAARIRRELGISA